MSYLKKLFCKHKYIELYNPDTNKFIIESEVLMYKKEITSYAYIVEMECVKCGKKKFEGSGMIC